MANLMFTLVIYSGGFLFFELIDLHIEDTYVMTKIKNLEIMAITITDIIKNDLTLTLAVLAESAASMSDVLNHETIRSSEWTREIDEGDRIKSNYDYTMKNTNAGLGYSEDVTLQGWYSRPVPYSLD
jgi:hypothetical protein